MVVRAAAAAAARAAATAAAAARAARAATAAPISLFTISTQHTETRQDTGEGVELDKAVGRRVLTETRSPYYLDRETREARHTTVQRRANGAA